MQRPRPDRAFVFARMITLNGETPSTMSTFRNIVPLSKRSNARRRQPIVSACVVQACAYMHEALAAPHAGMSTPSTFKLRKSWFLSKCLSPCNLVKRDAPTLVDVLVDVVCQCATHCCCELVATALRCVGTENMSNSMLKGKWRFSRIARYSGRQSRPGMSCCCTWLVTSYQQISFSDSHWLLQNQRKHKWCKKRHLCYFWDSLTENCGQRCVSAYNGVSVWCIRVSSTYT